MKYYQKILILILLLSGLLISIDDSVLSKEKIIGKVLSIVNNVQVLREDSGKLEQAYNLMEIYYGDQIKTFEDSKSMIIFNDKTQLKLDSKTIINVKKEESQPGKIELVTGAIWAKISPNEKSSRLNIVSPTSTCSIKGTELALKVEGDKKENFTTTLTVMTGNVEMSNKYGKSLIPASCQSVAYSSKAPTGPSKLSQEQIDKEISWIDFGNPRVMVVVEERNLGQTNLVSEMESEINTRLTGGHYHVIDPGQIDTIRETDEAKKAITGDVMAASTLGKRFGCDVTVTGKVDTVFISQEKTGEHLINLCEARCDIKVIVTDTAQVLFTKKIKTEGTSLSKEAAGIKALEKMSQQIGEDLVWEIPLGYITNYKGHRTMELIVNNCSFTDRDKIIEFLKTINTIDGKIFPRTFENSIAVIDVEYKGTSENLVHELLKIDTIKIDITGITMNRIEIKVVK